MPFIGSSLTNRLCWRRWRSAWRGWSGRMTGCRTSTRCRIPTTISNTCCTPIHDHRVWGVIGMLRGAEENQRYRLDATGLPVADGIAGRLSPGEVEKVSSRDGDIHRVSNALAESVSISIHVYGGNIGAVKRAVYTPEGLIKPFISGYSNRHLPNIWDFPKDN